MGEELRQEKFGGMGGGISNPCEPHMACVLLLDTSGSMSGAPIDSLNKGIRDFISQTSLDELAQKRVDVAIIEFNDTVRLVQDFTPLPKMEPVTLTADGCTAMGQAINFAIDKVKERNHFYDDMGTPCFRPWIFMITDGVPTDDITAAAERIKIEENKGEYGKIKFWACGVPGADVEFLKNLSRRVIMLDEKKFDGIFDWMSKSMVTISVSRVGENPQLPDLNKDAQAIPGNW